LLRVSGPDEPDGENEMKILLLAPLLLATQLSLAAGPAPAEPTDLSFAAPSGSDPRFVDDLYVFRVFDADEDGAIGPHEAGRSAPLKRHFADIDADEDGRITRSEWIAFFRHPPVPA
jgi:hypothetical protein